jgi:hypothetical protein
MLSEMILLLLFFELYETRTNLGEKNNTAFIELKILYAEISTRFAAVGRKTDNQLMA